MAAMMSPVVANAQDDPRVRFSLGGGFTMPNSDVRDRLGDGYNFTLALEFPVSPVVSIEGSYGFNGLGKKAISLPVFPTPVENGGVPTDFSGEMNMQVFSGSVIFQKPDGDVKPYGLVGAGVYYRPIKVTTPGVGYVPGYCDPWWYVCYPGGFVETDRIVGERSSTDFGMSFGGGLRFKKIFGEVRYHYIWGPELEAQDPVVNPLVDVPSASLVGKKANGQFLMTTFGVRF